MITRRDFIEGAAALAMMPKPVWEAARKSLDEAQSCAEYPVEDYGSEGAVWVSGDGRVCFTKKLSIKASVDDVFSRLNDLAEEMGIATQRSFVDGSSQAASYHQPWSTTDLAEFYPPGTSVWVTEDAGATWHEKIVQCRGHRWKRGKR